MTHRPAYCRPRKHAAVRGTTPQEDTMTTTEAKTRTITLTDRPPVRVVEADWPIVAHAKHREHDGEIPCQANRTTTAAIRVRQSANGKAVVYGTWDYDSAWRGERNLSIRAGHVGAPGDSIETIVGMIRRVGDDLVDRGADESTVRTLVAVCIGDLPPEDLT